MLCCFVVLLLSGYIILKEQLLFRWADLSEFFFVDFRRKKCVFLFHVQ